ncbi:MAG: ABC transporter substrate-binding protein [Anaerolineae bacterium]
MKTKVSRREFLRISAFTAASVALAGCRPTEAPPSATEVPTVPAPTVAPTEAPKVEQILRMLHDRDERDWSPFRGGGGHTRMLSVWWTPPAYYDGDGKLHPALFAEWSSNSDFTVWTFKMRDDVKFSDGSPVTAQDVVATWNVMTLPSSQHQRIGLFMSGVVGFAEASTGAAKTMPGLVAKDDYTVEVTLTAPDPVYYMRIASNLISPAKASQCVGPNGEEIFEWWHPKNGVACSGPFVPEKMDMDMGEVVFVRNPHFFGPTPKLEKVTVLRVLDDAVCTTMLQNREADGHLSLLTPTAIDDLGADFLSGPMIPKGQHFWLHCKRKPTDDLNVRKALIMAINFDELFQVSFPKGPNAKATMILNAVPGADDPEYVPFPYDPDGARAALAASSYGSAENLPKIMFVGISFPAAEAAAQYIAEQWRQVLGIQSVEMKAQYDQYSGPDQEHVQIFRDDVATRFPDPVAYLQGSIHSKSSNAQNKMGGYANPEVDRLIDEAATKSPDDPERTNLAMKAQRLFREDWQFIPWYHETNGKMTMPWVKEHVLNMDWQRVEPWKIYIEA